jgi:sugar lactone lactonase YvrE
MEITCVVDNKAKLGEGPVWDEQDQVLWWTDIKGKCMHCFKPATGTNLEYQLPVRVGCFALRENGGFLLAAEHGFYTWEPETNILKHIFDVEADREDNRMNDGGCDRQGRLLASSMSLADPRQPTGACWRVKTDMTCERIHDGLHVGNGIAFSPDGTTMYLADTPVNKVWAYPYDTDTGKLGEKRLFVDTENLAGKPDGATVDADGCYWLAGVAGWQLYRFTSEGKLDRTIDVPVEKPTCPMFGGKDLDDIYLTSIREGVLPEILEQSPQSGGLFVIKGAGFKGLPEPRFKG